MTSSAAQATKRAAIRLYRRSLHDGAAILLDFGVAAIISVLSVSVAMVIDLISQFHHDLSFQLTYVRSGQLSFLFSGIAYLNYTMLCTFVAGMVVQLFGISDAGYGGLTKLRAHMFGFRHLDFAPRMLSIHRSAARLVACGLVVGAGVSVGKESVLILTGAAVYHQLTRLLRSPAPRDDPRAIIGVVAGFVAAFGSPLTALVFCMLDLPRSVRSMRALRGALPVAVMTLLMVYTLNCSVRSKLSYAPAIGALSVALPSMSDVGRQWNIPLLLTLPLLGVACGLCGALLGGAINLVSVGRRIIQTRSSAWFVLTCVGGISSISFFIPTLMGRLDQDLASSLYMAGVVKQADDPYMTELVGIFLVKLFLTAVSYGVPVPGGLIMPTISIGAVIGAMHAVVARAMPWTWGTSIRLSQHGVTPYPAPAVIETGMFAICGSCGLLSTIMSPVTAVVLLVEVTGAVHLLPALIITAISSRWVASLIHAPSPDRPAVSAADVPVPPAVDDPIDPTAPVSLVMSDDVLCVPRVTTGAGLGDFLYGTYYPLFPVVDGRVPRGALLREDLAALAARLGPNDQVDLAVECPLQDVAIVAPDAGLQMVHELFRANLAAVLVCDSARGMSVTGIVTKRDLIRLPKPEVGRVDVGPDRLTPHGYTSINGDVDSDESPTPIPDLEVDTDRQDAGTPSTEITPQGGQTDGQRPVARLRQQERVPQSPTVATGTGHRGRAEYSRLADILDLRANRNF